MDITGQRYGQWLVIKQGPIKENGKYPYFWFCRCDCGTEKFVRQSHLIGGRTTSCGCNKDYHYTKHGQAAGRSSKSFSKKYNTWRYIKNRCTYPGSKDYDRYKGLLCDRWMEFENFNVDVPDPPPNPIDDVMSIERIENNKGYEPGNVRWIPLKEQHRNQTNCRWIEYNGAKKLLTEWSSEFGLNHGVLSRWIDRYGEDKAIRMGIQYNVSVALTGVKLKGTNEFKRFLKDFNDE